MGAEVTGIVEYLNGSVDRFPYEVSEGGSGGRGRGESERLGVGNAVGEIGEGLLEALDKEGLVVLWWGASGVDKARRSRSSARTLGDRFNCFIWRTQGRTMRHKIIMERGHP